MQIPSKQRCFEMLAREAMPEHIVAHSVQVCRVALYLVDGLSQSDPVTLDRGLVQAAALLHDITKPRSFASGENHSETGGALLRTMGFPEVGDIVRQHVRLDRAVGDGPLTEAAIVNYADKRVLHDAIVSLRRRMTYIIERYGRKMTDRSRFDRIWDETQQLEHRLFDALGLPPSALAAALPRNGIEAAVTAYRAACGSTKSPAGPGAGRPGPV